MGSCCITRGAQLGLCGDLEWWNVWWAGREAQEGGDICILIYVLAQHKLSRTQHCKAVHCCLATKLCLTLLLPHGLQRPRLLWPWDFPAKDTGVSCHFLLQGIFLTQGSKCISCIDRQILYHWATKEAPKAIILQFFKKFLLKGSEKDEERSQINHPGTHN